MASIRSNPVSCLRGPRRGSLLSYPGRPITYVPKAHFTFFSLANRIIPTILDVFHNELYKLINAVTQVGSGMVLGLLGDSMCAVHAHYVSCRHTQIRLRYSLMKVYLYPNAGP